MSPFLKVVDEGETRDELRVSIENDLGELARVSELATALLERIGAAASVVYATQLAIEEVLSNVIRHGFDDQGRHDIALVLHANAGDVELEVVDDGRPFDPSTAPAPVLDLPLVERSTGGLGIHLLRKFAREIRYERVRNRNLLRVRI